MMFTSFCEHGYLKKKCKICNPDIAKERVNSSNLENWDQVSKIIDERIVPGVEIPKRDGGTRTVTKVNESGRIYMKTGVKTDAQKYTTKKMIKFAYETMLSGRPFTSRALKSKFPREYNQGGCVFSMTGGILEFIGIAEYNSEKKGYILR